MAVVLQHRPEDGSVALFVDGDLQFDSRDERIYHECLALPALALASDRTSGPLRALICGGGDGLVARELLKSDRIQAIDLADYSPAILEMAASSLKTINDGSLEDGRVTVHVGDAWAFVEGFHGPIRSHLYEYVAIQDREGRFVRVGYGTAEITCEHAILLMRQEIDRATRASEALMKRGDDAPREEGLVDNALAMMGPHA